MRQWMIFPAAICALGLLLLAGCRPELDYVADSFHSSQATLSESGETITVLFNSEAGSASLDLSSSGAWTAEFVNGRAYWCSLSQSEGKRGVASLTFTVQANGEYDERSASVVFTSGKLKRTIVVVQKQHDSMLLSSERVEMDADGGTFSIEVSANIDFSHRIEENGSSWIHVLSTKGLSKSVVTFAVDANTALDRRSGTVTFNSVNGPETVTVYQKGETPTIVISEENVSLSAEEGICKVEVASNLDVEFTIPEDCAWLREVKTRTISTNTYTFAYDRNHARESRACEIVFRNDAFAKADTVRIEQQKSGILRSDSRVYCPSTGETFAILTVGAVDDFGQLHFDSDWPEEVSVEPDAEGNRFLVQIGANPTPYVRRTGCDVYRPGFDEPDHIEFVQFGQNPSFSYQTSLREVVVPELDGLEETALVFWGDGTWEAYSEELTHTYAGDGIHTIRIESISLPFVLIHFPKTGAQFDFTRLRNN